MNIYRRQLSETVFDRLWCCVFLLHRQAARDGLLLDLEVLCIPACVQATKPEVWRMRHTEKMFLMIPAGQLMPGTKRPPWGLGESVSDNCSITRPIGWLVWESGLRRMSA